MRMSATLHDGSTAPVTTLGSGPALLLPVDVTPVEGPAADQMRQWGADPDLGHTLATGLAEHFTVVVCDYQGALERAPKPDSLTAEAVVADLLAIADAAGCDRFAYYGYSWLALAGLQLATRTGRLTALAMGGFPPLGGPYGAMLTVTEASHRMAAEPSPPAQDVVPGDWDSVEVVQSEAQTGQFVTLYRSLEGFDEAAALATLTCPRLAFAGGDDDIVYGPKWDNARVEIGPALRRHRDELERLGWTVSLLPGLDHMGAMQAEPVLATLLPWLRSALAA